MDFISRRIIAALAATLALAPLAAGCAPKGPGAVRAEAPPAPQAPTAGPDAPAADACGANALQAYVGRPKTELPTLPGGAITAREVCSSCSATMDFSPARLNIIFDERTGLITELRCG